jgi:hypothetical protein
MNPDPIQLSPQLELEASILSFHSTTPTPITSVFSSATGETPKILRCPNPDCFGLLRSGRPNKFANKPNLDRHMNRYHSADPEVFHCQKGCGYSDVAKSNVERHEIKGYCDRKPPKRQKNGS